MDQMLNRRNFILKAGFIGAASATGIGAFTSHPASAQEAYHPGGFSLRIAASNAPQHMKEAADIVCTGINDQSAINHAMATLMPDRSGLGGTVELSPGTFNMSGPIGMRPRMRLIGSGRATILKAMDAWNSINTPDKNGGIVEANSLGIDKAHIASLAINGNWRNIHGIYFNVTEKWFDDGSPDSANTFTDLYVYQSKLDGVHLTGSRMRATCLSRIRVWNVGGYGYFLNNNDSFYSQLETGSSGNSGFCIKKANNRFTNCKAWYSDGHGFQIQSVRNEFSACESQDNEKHGFSIEAGQVTLNSCHADSNSWNRHAPSNAYSGFYIKRYHNYVQLIGCQAYDKNEGDRGNWQGYGFELGGKNDYCQIIGSTKDNAMGRVHDPDPGVDTMIDVVGT